MSESRAPLRTQRTYTEQDLESIAEAIARVEIPGVQFGSLIFEGEACYFAVACVPGRRDRLGEPLRLRGEYRSYRRQDGPIFAQLLSAAVALNARILRSHMLVDKQYPYSVEEL